MRGISTGALLGANDPDPVELFNRDGASPFVLTCEHAGRHVPEALDDLGLGPEALARHIAWDIGAGAVSRLLAEALDAPLVSQPMSRLVIDCNRPYHVPALIPKVSDGTAVPGNQGLDDTDRQARIDAIHTPFHDAIRDILDERRDAGRPCAVVAVHSFTPKMQSNSDDRPWHVTFLFNRNPDLSRRMLAALLSGNDGIVSTLNEPYVVEDDGDYTVPVHGEQRGIPSTLIELRNDHITDPAGQEEWAFRLSRTMTAVARELWR